MLHTRSSSPPFCHFEIACCALCLEFSVGWILSFCSCMPEQFSDWVRDIIVTVWQVITCWQLFVYQLSEFSGIYHFGNELFVWSIPVAVHWCIGCLWIDAFRHGPEQALDQTFAWTLHRQQKVNSATTRKCKSRESDPQPALDVERT